MGGGGVGTLWFHLLHTAGLHELPDFLSLVVRIGKNHVVFRSFPRFVMGLISRIPRGCGFLSVLLLLLLGYRRPSSGPERSSQEISTRFWRGRRSTKRSHIAIVFLSSAVCRFYIKNEE